MLGLAQPRNIRRIPLNEVNLQDTESLEFVQTAFRYEFLHLTATQLIKLFSYLQLKYFLELSLTAALTQGCSGERSVAQANEI